MIFTKCTEALPPNGLDVLVTDGKSIWIGDYNSKRSYGPDKWAVVWNRAPPFQSHNIVAWTFFPDVELSTDKHTHNDNPTK